MSRTPIESFVGAKGQCGGRYLVSRLFLARSLFSLHWKATGSPPVCHRHGRSALKACGENFSGAFEVSIFCELLLSPVPLHFLLRSNLDAELLGEHVMDKRPYAKTIKLSLKGHQVVEHLAAIEYDLRGHA